MSTHIEQIVQQYFKDDKNSSVGGTPWIGSIPTPTDFSFAQAGSRSRSFSFAPPSNDGGSPPTSPNRSSSRQFFSSPPPGTHTAFHRHPHRHFGYAHHPMTSKQNALPSSPKMSFSASFSRASFKRSTGNVPPAFHFMRSTSSTPPLPLNAATNTFVPNFAGGTSTQDSSTLDLATSKFLSSLMLLPPLYQFYADDRTLRATSSMRLEQQNDNARRSSISAGQLTSHSGVVDQAKVCSSPSTRTHLRRPTGSLKMSFPSGVGTSQGTTTGEEGNPAVSLEEETVLSPGTQTTSRKWPEGSSPSPENTFVGCATLNSFVLCSQAHINQASVAKAVCPKVLTAMKYEDAGSAYYTILLFFRNKYGPFTNVTQRVASGFRDWDDHKDSHNVSALTCGYPFYEKYVKYFPDVYANFSQPPVHCLLMLYQLLPRKVQKGLDALTLFIEETHTQQSSSGATTTAGAAGSSVNTRSGQTMNLNAGTPGFQPPPDAFSTNPQEEPMMSPNLTSEPSGFPIAFGAEIPTRNVTPSPAAAEEFSSPSVQFPSTTSTYDDISNLVNQLIQSGDRHIALHVLLATCRYRTMDQILAAFRHVLSVFPSMKMTTVSLAMNVWRILHCIIPRSMEYTVMAKTLVNTLLQYLHQHTDMASLMTGLVGIRHLAIWESYTYRSLLMTKLEEIILAVWGVLFHASGTSSSTLGPLAAPRIGELAAATLKELFLIALEQRRFHLVQNCVAHAVNCIAGCPSGATPISGAGDFLIPGKGSNRDGSSTSPSILNDNGDGGGEREMQRNGSQVFPNVSFDLSFSPPCNYSKGGFNDSVGVGTSRQNVYTLPDSSSIPGRFVTDSYLLPESDFASQVVSIGSGSKEDDNIEAGSLVLSAFLSAWHSSGQGRLDASQISSPSSCSKESTSGSARYRGLPLPLLEEETNASLQRAGFAQSWSSFRLQGQNAAGDQGPRRGVYSRKWSFLTSEKAEFLIPPMNSDLFSSRRSSSAKPSVTRSRRFSDGCQEKRTQSAPPEVRLSKDTRSSSSAALNGYHNKVEKQIKGLDYYLPVEAALQIMQKGIERSASQERIEKQINSTPLSPSNAVTQISASFAPCIEHVFPLLIRAYGSSIPQEMILKATLQVVNRLIRDLKRREQPNENPLGPSKPVDKEKGNPHSPGTRSESSAKQDVSDSGPLLRATVLLCAIAPFYPKVFEVILVNKMSQCLSHALHYGSRTYSSLAYPALGLIVHNIPQPCNTTKCISVLEHLCQLGMSAPFSVVQATVTASIGAVLPSFSRSLERFILRNIVDALRQPDEYSTAQPKHQNQKTCDAKEDKDKTPEKSHRNSRNSTPLRSERTLNFPRSPIKSEDVQLSSIISYKPLSLYEESKLAKQTPSDSPFLFPTTGFPLNNSLTSINNGSTTTPITSLPQLLFPAEEEQPRRSKKFMCFHVLRVLGHCWDYTTSFFLENCIDYTHHHDPQLRLAAVQTCVTMLLQDCFHEGYRLSSDTEAQHTKKRNFCKSSQMVLNQKRNSVDLKNISSKLARGLQEGTTNSPGFNLEAELGRDEGPTIPLDEYVFCDVHTGFSHINTIREIVHTLVDVAVCDPEEHIRLAALKALGAEVMQFLYPHKRMINCLFVILNDPGLKNRTEAVRILAALAPQNPIIYRRLREVFLLKLDHFVKSSACVGPSSKAVTTDSMLPASNDKNTSRSRRSPSIPRHPTGIESKFLQDEGLHPLRIVDEDLSLLIAITGTLLNSSPLYLSHLLSMLQRVLAYPTSHSRTTIINVLRLLTQLHDDSCVEDWALFEPFLATVARQLMIRDGDTERLLATVATLQSLFQSRMVEYALSKDDQQLTVRWLHSLNYQKPSIGPELSVAILKLLGTISSKESYIASFGTSYHQQLPLLLQRPRDLYEVPRISNIAAVASAAITFGKKDILLIPRAAYDAEVLTAAPHPLKPFSKDLWPDTIVRVLLHALLDHINYTTTLTREGIEECLDTILKILLYTEAGAHSAEHLISFLNIYFHLAYAIPPEHQQLSEAGNFRVCRRLSSVLMCSDSSLPPLFPLIHSLLLHMWKSGSNIKRLSCCRIIYTLVRNLPGLMRKHAKMWVEEVFGYISNCQSLLTEEEGLSLVQVYVQEGDDGDDLYGMNRLFDVEPVQTSSARWYGMAIITTVLSHTLLTLLPVAPRESAKFIGFRLSYILVSSGVLLSGTDAGGPVAGGTAASFSGPEKLPHLGGQERSPSSVSTESVAQIRSVRRETGEDDNESMPHRSRNVLVNHMRYDQMDLMSITRERLAAMMNHSICQTIVAYLNATEDIRDIAPNIIEQCLQRLHVLAEGHRNALQVLFQSNAAGGPRTNAFFRRSSGTPRQTTAETRSSSTSSMSDNREEEEKALFNWRQNSGNKERLREALWAEQSTLQNIEYRSVVGSAARRFPFEDFRSSWETCAEMDLLACVFMCFSRGGNAVNTIQQHISNYISFRFGVKSFVSAFFRCATLSTYRCVVRQEIWYGSLCGNRHSSPMWSSSGPSSVNENNAPSLLNARAPLKAVSSDLMLGDNFNDAMIPVNSLSHAASAETLNFDENIAAYSGPCRTPISESVPNKSPPLPIVGQLHATYTHQSNLFAGVMEPGSPLPVSSNNDQIPGPNSPPLSDTTEIPEHHDNNMPFSTSGSEVSSAQVNEVVEDQYQNNCSLEEDVEEHHENLKQQDFTFSHVEGNAQLDAKFFDRTFGSFHDMTRTDLLDLFEKHLAICSHNLPDWKPWFEHFSFSLVDNCKECSVELCAPLIKKHKFPILSSDLLGVSFVAVLSTFSEPQLRAFLAAFRHFYEVSRDIPHNVACEMLRLAHFLRLYGPTVFSADVFKNIVNVEISPSFMVLVAKRALNPTLMMMYLEMESSRCFTWDELHLSVSVFDDVLTPFFQNAYALTDARMTKFLKQESPSTYTRWMQRSISCGKKCPSAIGVHSLKQCPACIVAHLKRIPSLGAALEQSSINGNLLALLGYIHAAADRFLAPHKQLLNRKLSPRKCVESFVSIQSENMLEEEGLFCPAPILNINFSDFIRNALQVMRSYTWVYDFTSILKLWNQIGDLLVLHPCGSSVSMNPSHFSENTVQSSSTNTKDVMERDTLLKNSSNFAPRGTSFEYLVEGNHFVFSGDSTNVPAKEEDIQRSLEIMQFAAASSMALSQWDTTLEVTSMARRFIHVLQIRNLKRSEDKSIESSSMSFPKKPRMPRPSSYIKAPVNPESGEEFTDRNVPILVQMEINRAAALIATSHLMEAKRVLKKVRALLLEETVYSVFQTEHPRAKLELNCMYQQISDLEEGVENRELTRKLYVVPDIAEDRANRRLRNIACRPFTSNMTILQCFRLLAARSSVVAPSWQLQNILMLSEQLHLQGMPMRAVWTLRHFQHLVSQEVASTSAARECENELRLERYRLLLKTLTVRDQLIHLQKTILAALRTDSNSNDISEGSFDGVAPGSVSTVPFLSSNNPSISVPELCRSMTCYQANLLLLHLGCRRRIAEFGVAIDSTDASPSPNRSSPRGRSINSPIMFSKTRWPGTSPPGLTAEGTQQWNSLELGNRSSFALQSPNYNDFTRSSSPLSIRQRASNDFSDYTAGFQNAYSYESAILEDYYLLEHAISYTVTSMPGVWCDFGLVLFDICIAMHLEYERTKDPETLQNFHAQSKKAINALQQAARLWKQNSMREEGGIGEFTSAFHPRLRHARSGLPVAYLLNKAFYLANRCEETPLSQDSLDQSPTTAVPSSEINSAGFFDLNFSPEMYTHWAAIGPLLFGGAVRHKVICNRVEEMCRNSLTLTYQFLPLLVACFEHDYNTALGHHHRLPHPKAVRDGSGVTCVSAIVARVAEASPAHALAVEETIRISHFGMNENVMSSEITLDGACKLPLPVWIQSLEISIIKDNLLKKETMQQRSSSKDTNTSHNAKKNLQNIAQNSTGSHSLINRGVLAAYRTMFTSSDLAGEKRSETVFTMLLVDGSQMHLHRSTSIQKTFGTPVMHNCSSADGLNKKNATGERVDQAQESSAKFFTEVSDNGADSQMSTPLSKPHQKPSQGNASYSSSDDWQFVVPYSFMEISLSVLLSHLPLLYFRSPFVFPLDLQNYMTQLPESRVARNNSLKSSTLPATLKETNCIPSSLTPNSICHIQESFDILQRRMEVANAGVHASKVPPRGDSHSSCGFHGMKNSDMITGLYPDPLLQQRKTGSVSSLSYTRSSNANHRLYVHLIGQSFDTGDPLPLLEFLERLLFTMDDTKKIAHLNTFEDMQERYAFQVQLPRPMKELCKLYLGLRELYPRDDGMSQSDLRHLCSDVLKERPEQKNTRRHSNPLNGSDDSVRFETEDESSVEDDSSVDSLRTPRLDNEETKANLQTWRGTESAFSTETPLMDAVPGSGRHSAFCGASGQMEKETIRTLKQRVRLIILSIESERYENGIKAAFDAEASYPSQWMEARRSFTQELAEWSLLQYMLDIPERDCERFFIYPVTGHVATHQLSRVALQRCSHRRSSSCESVSGFRGDATRMRERIVTFSESDEDEEELPIIYRKNKRCPNIMELLSSPFPTRDASFFRLTKSMEKVLWGESSASSFLSHLAEGLYQLLQYHRALTGILRYGLDEFTVWAWIPPSTNQTDNNPSNERCRRYSTSVTESDLRTPDTVFPGRRDKAMGDLLQKTSSANRVSQITEGHFLLASREEDMAKMDEDDDDDVVDGEVADHSYPREDDLNNSSIEESALTHARTETQQWMDRKEPSLESLCPHPSSFLKDTASSIEVPVSVPSLEMPPKVPRFFDTSSLRRKLQCRAILSRHGDTEEANRKEELAYLSREREENSDIFSPQSLRHNMGESLEELQPSEVLSDPSKKSQEVSPQNSSVDPSVKEIPQVPPLNIPHLLQPPLDSVTAYDWASLLINVARDELSLIGSEEYPHLWATWAPHW